MRKEYTRDYATEMFRVWAAAGCPTYEQERERVRRDEMEKWKYAAPPEAIVRVEIAVQNAAPYLLDIMAAQKTIELLERGGRGVIAKAVKEVYCVYPSRPMRRGDITGRVRRFALECPTDARTVYRWLKEARSMCAAIRGLRIPDDERTETLKLFPYPETVEKLSVVGSNSVLY